MTKRRIWWATWPGALAMGALALVLVAPGAIVGFAALLIPDTTGAGLDFEVPEPPVWPRIVGGLAALVALILPILTVRWARKKWLGYLLLALGVSGVVGIVGLVMLGIL